MFDDFCFELTTLACCPLRSNRSTPYPDIEELPEYTFGTCGLCSTVNWLRHTMLGLAAV